MLLLFNSFVALADSAEAEECAGALLLDATNQNGICHMDLSEICSFYPGQQCSSWCAYKELVAHDPDREILSCGKGSDIGYRSLYKDPSKQIITDFDKTGAMLGYRFTDFESTPWCCGGKAAYGYQFGVVGELCLPEEADDSCFPAANDTQEPASPPASCACSHNNLVPVLLPLLPFLRLRSKGHST